MYDAIIFNNPFVEIRNDPANAALIREFLQSARTRLKSNGEIHINITQEFLKDYPLAAKELGLLDNSPAVVAKLDQNGNSYSTSHHYVHSSVEGHAHAAYTPWFTDNNALGKWGEVVIFELSFKTVGNSAYDLADVMVHEAMHAWQQYTLAQLAQNPNSNFSQYAENQTYYTKEWQSKYNNVMEYEASSYVLWHTPQPLCTRDFIRKNELDYLNLHFNFDPIPGIHTSPWPMAGYPLP